MSFYSLVYMAGNGVNDLLKVKNDFTTKVGEQDKNSLYASQVDEYAWLNTENDSLRAENYKGAITRAEAVYMLMNMNFSDEMVTFDTSAVSLEDAKDGGQFLEDTNPDKKVSNELYSVEGKQKQLAKGWKLGVLSKMLQDQEGNVHTDIYKALCLANNLGVIEAETRYNEPLSKAESIELYVRTMDALNKQNGYITEIEHTAENEAQFSGGANGTQGEPVEMPEGWGLDDGTDEQPAQGGSQVEQGKTPGDASGRMPKPDDMSQEDWDAMMDRLEEIQANSGGVVDGPNCVTSEHTEFGGKVDLSGATPGKYKWE